MKIFSGDSNGECAQRGFGFEHVARRVFEHRGYATKDATSEEAIKGHVDFWVKDKYNNWRSVDAKAMKKLSRQDTHTQDEWTFIEWQNNVGRPGWLVNGAEFLVFERSEHIFLIKRRILCQWAKSKVNFDLLCMKSADAQYKVYSRQGRDDLTSLIRLDDVPQEVRLLWQKNIDEN